MSLIEKRVKEAISELSEAVLKNPENYIDEYDLRFCQKNQKIYENSYKLLEEFAQELDDAWMKFPESEFPCENPYLDPEFTSAYVRSKIDAANCKFICLIANYFAQKYYISIDEKAIFETVRDLRLSCFFYLDILCAIIIQTGGEPVFDKGLSVIKETAHKAAQEDSTDKPCYQIQKETLIFPDRGCYVDSWYGTFSLTDRLKDIVCATWYFNKGGSFSECEISDRTFQTLLQDRFADAVHSVAFGKVAKIRCYKKGRVDIQFADQTYLKAFLREYLKESV